MSPLKTGVETEDGNAQSGAYNLTASNYADEMDSAWVRRGQRVAIRLYRVADSITKALYSKYGVKRRVGLSLNTSLAALPPDIDRSIMIARNVTSLDPTQGNANSGLETRRASTSPTPSDRDSTRRH